MTPPDQKPPRSLLDRDGCEHEACINGAASISLDPQGSSDMTTIDPSRPAAAPGAGPVDLFLHLD
jgi:hypothetical protein